MRSFRLAAALLAALSAWSSAAQSQCCAICVSVDRCRGSDQPWICRVYPVSGGGYFCLEESSQRCWTCHLAGNPLLDLASLGLGQTGEQCFLQLNVPLYFERPNTLRIARYEPLAQANGEALLVQQNTEVRPKAARLDQSSLRKLGAEEPALAHAAVIALAAYYTHGTPPSTIVLSEAQTTYFDADRHGLEETMKNMQRPVDPATRSSPTDTTKSVRINVSMSREPNGEINVLIQQRDSALQMRVGEYRNVRLLPRADGTSELVAVR